MNADLLALGASSTTFTAPLWWQSPAALSGVMQQQQPFRRSQPRLDYALLPEDDDQPPFSFRRDEDDGTWRALGNLLDDLPLHYGARVHSWGHAGYEDELSGLAGRQGLTLSACAMRYGRISLACERNESGTLTDRSWRWHPHLGFTPKK